MKKETKRAYQSPATQVVTLSSGSILEGSTDPSQVNESLINGGSLNEYF